MVGSTHTSKQIVTTSTCKQLPFFFLGCGGREPEYPQLPLSYSTSWLWGENGPLIVLCVAGSSPGGMIDFLFSVLDLFFSFLLFSEWTLGLESHLVDNLSRQKNILGDAVSEGKAMVGSNTQNIR